MNNAMKRATMKRTSAPCAGLLALLLCAAAAASNGDYEINQDCVAVGCFEGDAAGSPVTISVAGRYVLTSNLAPPPGTAPSAIEITASDVDLDLNGHVLDGGATCSGTPVTTCSGFTAVRGVLIDGPTAAIVRVHDGTIRGFGGSGVVGFSVGSGSEFERLVLTENSFGILLVAANNQANIVIRGSSIVRNAQSGGGVANNIDSRLQVEDCIIAGNQSFGMNVGTGSTLTGNRFNSNGGIALTCNGGAGICALSRNSFFANNGGGAANQWTIPVVRDMGGNVCMDDGTCP